MSPGMINNIERRPMILNIELEQEEDGRWIAEVAELSGVMA
jgi:predicted RNase H-like HicB family nuclease